MLRLNCLMAIIACACLASCSGGGGSDNAVLVADIWPGPTGSDGFGNRAVLGGYLYFDAASPEFGHELWRTDGTTTELVADIVPGPDGSYPRELTVCGGRIYFLAIPSVWDLYVTDGVTTDRVVQTARLNDLDLLTNFNGTLFFRAWDAFFGTELWSFDGATLNLATDLNPLSGDSNPNSLTVLGGNLYFRATDGVNRAGGYFIGGFGLIQIPDPVPFPANFGFGISFQVLNGILFFIGVDSDHGIELWRSADGITELDTDVNPGPNFGVVTLFRYDDFLVFNGYDSERGSQLWAHDGVLAVPLTDIDRGGEGFFPANFTEIDNVLYMSGLSPERGRELWTFDGKQVRPLGEIDPGPNSSGPFGMVKFGKHIYFGASTRLNGRELWRLEGDQPVLVKDFLPGPADGLLGGPTVVGDKLYVYAATPATGNELFRVTAEDE